MSWLHKSIPELFKSCIEDIADTANRVSEWKDRKALEKALNARKETARDYEQNGVPPGDQYYVLIYGACLAELTQFCNKYDHSLELTMMQYPFLRGLKKMAHPESEGQPEAGFLAKAFGLSLVAAILCFVGGAATGLWSGGHEWVKHFFV